jgi:hypothetical protein
MSLTSRSPGTIYESPVLGRSRYLETTDLSAVAGGIAARDDGWYDVLPFSWMPAATPHRRTGPFCWWRRSTIVRAATRRLWLRRSVVPGALWVLVNGRWARRNHNLAARGDSPGRADDILLRLLCREYQQFFVYDKSCSLFCGRKPLVVHYFFGWLSIIPSSRQVNSSNRRWLLPTCSKTFRPSPSRNHVVG